MPQAIAPQKTPSSLARNMNHCFESAFLSSDPALPNRQGSTNQNTINDSLDPEQRQYQLDRMTQDSQEAKGKTYLGDHSVSIRSILAKLADLIEMDECWIEDPVKALPEASAAWFCCLLSTNPVIEAGRDREYKQ